MQAHTNALPLVSERAEIRLWRPVEPNPNRSDASETPEIGQDAFALYNHGGTVAVTSLWLVIYVVAVTQPFFAWALSLIASLL